ncbi:hypothetical protein Taro_019382 [Colocasia esculenta]|uniref:RNase H type-1 domain-containing protein n=1 Tax=Colocasia esculenta TaxID=4460 RepID=A0A843V5B6_COLES|nr:hypothetical protein [Colocasia esculenta]
MPIRLPDVGNLPVRLVAEAMLSFILLLDTCVRYPLRDFSPFAGGGSGYGALMGINIQGRHKGVSNAASRKSLKNTVKKHNPQIVGISEPKTSFSKALALCKSLRMDSCAGNMEDESKIWVFWRTQDSVQVVASTSQSISLVCNAGTSSMYYLTVVYADCNPAVRRDLFSDLLLFAQSLQNVLWLVTGDFNYIAQPSEKLDGNLSSSISMFDFNDFIMAAGLFDAGYIGSPYIWSNNGTGSASVRSRLDRALFNSLWQDNMPGTIVHHLPHGVSDHSPLLDSIEAAESIVSHTEQEFDSNPSEANTIAMSEAQARLRQALLNDEKLWCQKARMEWLQNGDRNTAFYQAVVKNNRRKNYIHRLKIEGADQWCEDQEKLKEVASSFFEGLLTTEQTIVNADLLQLIPHLISEEHNSSLCAIPGSDEVKAAVKVMNGKGALGPDGFPGSFYSICWDIVGEDVLPRWNPPQYGFSLNVDGACKGNPGPCGGCGCIRDSNGDIHLGFAFYYGQGNNMLAEVRALCDGLRLAEHRGLPISTVNSDSLALVHSFNSNMCPSWKCTWWWRIARSSLSKPNIKLVHVYLDTNRMADALTSYACDRGGEIACKTMYQNKIKKIKNSTKSKCLSTALEKPVDSPAQTEHMGFWKGSLVDRTKSSIDRSTQETISREVQSSAFCKSVCICRQMHILLPTDEEKISIRDLHMFSTWVFPFTMTLHT